MRYKNRKDVMLIRLAPGTAMAGVFTRSTTRSACVRDCQTKLAGKISDDAGAAIIVNSGNSNAFTGKVGEDIGRRRHWRNRSRAGYPGRPRVLLLDRRHR